MPELRSAYGTFDRANIRSLELRSSKIGMAHRVWQHRDSTESAVAPLRILLYVDIIYLSGAARGRQIRLVEPASLCRAVLHAYRTLGDEPLALAWWQQAAHCLRFSATTQNTKNFGQLVMNC